jgi:hypothetical protein
LLVTGLQLLAAQSVDHYQYRDAKLRQDIEVGLADSLTQIGLKVTIVISKIIRFDDICEL